MLKINKNIIKPALVGLVATSLIVAAGVELSESEAVETAVASDPVVLESMVVEEPVEYVTEPLTVKPVEITLYNETMFGTYQTGYPVYGTDIVLECDYTACYANGYYAIVINEHWSEKYPRGATGSIEYNDVGYPVMVVDYRAIEHSTDYYDVGLILGETKGGLEGAYIYE